MLRRRLRWAANLARPILIRGGPTLRMLAPVAGIMRVPNIIQVNRNLRE
jgi:hypothetical protein